MVHCQVAGESQKHWPLAWAQERGACWPGPQKRSHRHPLYDTHLLPHQDGADLSPNWPFPHFCLETQRKVTESREQANWESSHESRTSDYSYWYSTGLWQRASPTASAKQLWEHQLHLLPTCAIQDVSSRLHGFNFITSILLLIPLELRERRQLEPPPGVWQQCEDVLEFSPPTALASSLSSSKRLP
jgi:hypothetical protein